MKVDFINALPPGPGPYTLIKKTGALPSTLPTLVTPSAETRTPTFAWEPGTGLTVSFFTKALSGTVFEDNGAGGGTGGLAYDGVKNGTEAGVSGVTVTLADDTSGTTIDTTTTAADGGYVFNLEGILNTSLKVITTVPAGRLAISEAVNASGGTIGSATDGQITNIPNPALSIIGVNFGQVRTPTLSPVTSSKVAQAGLSAFHAVRYDAYAPGSVTLTATATPATGWTVNLLTENVDCNGEIGSGEGAPVIDQNWSTSLKKYCLVARVTPPAGAATGSYHAVTITATTKYNESGATVTIPLSMMATTAVSEGVVNLHKAVFKENPSVPGDWITAETAAPGMVLKYVLTYTNTSAKTVTDIHVTDKTPDYTTYVDPATLLPDHKNARCATIPPGTVCSVLPPEPDSGSGWTGNLEWRLDQLNSGATGTLEYQVQVDQ